MPDITNSPKTLDNVDIADVQKKVPDVQVVGDGNLFKLLSKASSKAESWMKSTKAYEIPGIGCLVQVTTQQGNNVSEALTFVPGVRVIEDVNGGKRLTSNYS